MSENPDNKNILNERHIVERMGELGGKTYTRTADGGMQKEVRLPVCDQCGCPYKIFVICQRCGHKLGTNNGCAVFYRNRSICVNCLQQILPLERKDYLVLSHISTRMRSLKEISRAIMLSVEEILQSLTQLEQSGMVRREGVSIFSRIVVTDDGTEALRVYAGVYNSQTRPIVVIQEDNGH